MIFSVIALTLAAVAGAIGLLMAYIMIKDLKQEMTLTNERQKHAEELRKARETFIRQIDHLQRVREDETAALKDTIRDLEGKLYSVPHTEDKPKQASLEELNKLRLFKKFTHQYLDQLGVPTDPEPDANHGCRMGSRFQWLLNNITDRDDL